MTIMSASVAHANAHPTGDQEVVNSIPASSGKILLWSLIMKYFLSILSLLIQEGQLSVSVKRMCTSTRLLRGQSLPRKSVVGQT